MKNKPNVLVAGFSRCATTYLFNLLKQHPEIHIPKEKEINFLHKYPLLLSHPHLINPKYFLPKLIYYNKFRANKKIKMDFSMMTSYDLSSAKRIRILLGEIKIIFIRRDKKDHLKSVIKTLQNHGEKIPKNVDSFSDFEKYIDPYKQNFSKLLEITKEDLEVNPEKTLEKIVSFLNINNYDFDLDVYRNASKSYFKDKHRISSKFFIFRIKRNFLKFLSNILTLLDKNLKNRPLTK